MALTNANAVGPWSGVLHLPDWPARAEPVAKATRQAATSRVIRTSPIERTILWGTLPYQRCCKKDRRGGYSAEVVSCSLAPLPGCFSPDRWKAKLRH
jgi:hypothetical protein